MSENKSKPDRGLSSLIAIDDRDTRLEVLRLFEKLDPQKRLSFLQWCERTLRQEGLLPENMTLAFQPRDPRAGLAAEESAIMLYELGVHYGLNLQQACKALEFFVRKLA